MYGEHFAINYAYKSTDESNQEHQSKMNSVNILSMKYLENFKTTINNKLVVSLFCGIGGLDLGFESAGFQIAIAVDNNSKVLAAYQKNFPNTLTLYADIANLSPKEIKDLIFQKYPEWDGSLAAVIGGPPCQPFSAAGKQNPNDERNQLIIKYIDLVVGLQPETFVKKNFPAVEWHKFSHLSLLTDMKNPHQATLCNKD